MENGQQDDIICLDHISLADEDCGLPTLDEEDNCDNVDLSNQPNDVASPTG